MEIYERLEAIMNSEKIDRQEFSQLTGISNSTLTQAKNRTKINFRLENYEKILECFPNINRDWLIWGEGTMLREISKSQQPSLFDVDDVTESKSDGYEQKNANSDAAVSPVITQKIENSGFSANLQLSNEKSTATPTENSAPSTRIEYIEISPKKVQKIILYYSDNTFQEFEGKND
jgi:DNA-binding Xre family transcriptional regulator